MNIALPLIAKCCITVDTHIYIYTVYDTIGANYLAC